MSVKTSTPVKASAHKVQRLVNLTTSNAAVAGKHCGRHCHHCRHCRSCHRCRSCGCGR